MICIGVATLGRTQPSRGCQDKYIPWPCILHTVWCSWRLSATQRYTRSESAQPHHAGRYSSMTNQNLTLPVHAKRNLWHPQLMLSSAGCKGCYRYRSGGHPSRRALLVLVGAEMYPESVRRIQFYLGAAEEIVLQLSCFSNLVTFFFFFLTSLCNPCFKALKARDYSGNAKTGWHIVAFADSRRKGCKSFVPDSLIFSLYLNYSHWEKKSVPCC